MKLSDWIVVDDYCACRVVEGGDPGNVADRRAFIEKTPRVRMPDNSVTYGSSPEMAGNYDPSMVFWFQGPKGSGGSDPEKNGHYGFDPRSRAWADSVLVALGYEIN